jgi:hypothetical protein
MCSLDVGSFACVYSNVEVPDSTILAAATFEFVLNGAVKNLNRTLLEIGIEGAM